MPSLLSLNEQIIRGTVSATQTAYYYGFELTLSQSDVPYIPVPGSRPASQFHFVVCADTVTISESLVNPGMDIRIYARQINFLPGAALDTGGGDTATTFLPGDLPDQTDETPGAPGAIGTNASIGSSAGNVILMAESILGPAGAVPGSVNIGLLVPAQLALPDFNLPLNWSGQGVTITGTFSFSAVQVTGAAGGELRASGFSASVNSGNQTVELVFTLAGAVLSAQVSFSGTATISSESLPYTDTLTMSAGSTSASVTMTLSSAGPSSPQSAVLFTNFQPAYQDSDPFRILSSALVSIETALQQQLASSMQTVLGSSVSGAAPDVVILTNGGDGGRGQDGQPGVQGAQGTPGANVNTVIFPPQSFPADTIGGTGAQGGQGGNPGTSGSGGQGGNVQLAMVIPAPVAIAFDDAGGNGGAAPTAGAGGPGGLGGVAGSCYESDGGPSIQVQSHAGTKGPQGPPAALQGVPGAAGATGAATINGTAVASGATYAPSSYAVLAPWFPTEQLLITQRVASFGYLDAQTQQDYQDVLTLFLWLQNITAPFLSTSFVPQGWQPADIALAQQINAFATAQISNFQAGFDYYGHPFDWVPILTLDEYQSNITELLAIGEDIEDQFNAYMAENQTEANQLAAVQATNGQLQSSVANLQQQLTGLGQQIQAADQAIAVMITQLEQQQNSIAADTETFTVAFQQYTTSQTGCSFTEVISAISAIVQIGTGLVDGIGLVSGAFAAENALNTGIQTFKYAITIIEKVNSAITAIQTGLTNIEKLIPSPNPDNVSAMLAADQQDFDTFIGQYLGDFSAAGVLQQAVDDYFSMVNALNQAILSYNGLYVTQAGLQAQLNQYTQQLEQLGAVLAQSQPDPTLPTCVSFMQSAYDSIKSIIVQQLYEENRAYYFWSLEDQPFSTDDLTIASLALTHGDLITQIEQTQEQSSAPYQPFTQAFTISAADLPLAFSQLPSSQFLSFSISPDAPELDNMYQVNVSSYTLEFPDITGSSNTLFVELQHPGVCVQVANDETVVQFTHAQRSVPYKIDYADSSNTGGGAIGATDQGFIGLSPLTQWTLNFNEAGNEWLDLSIVKSVVITFTGTFVGPPTATLK
jgi:hypothetical protein